MSKPTRRLTCCCCGSECTGRQWYNRDTGFGLCASCADWIALRETPEDMLSNYGRRGEHYCVATEPSPATS